MTLTGQNSTTRVSSLLASDNVPTCPSKRGSQLFRGLMTAASHFSHPMKYLVFTAGKLSAEDVTLRLEPTCTYE